MTAVPQVLKNWSESVSLPTIYDITTYFEPSAHFQLTRKIRNDFDELAQKYSKSTWMLGSHGGKAQLQTDIQGIGVATRIEVGRLSFSEERSENLIANAFEMCRVAEEQGLTSGPVDRVLVRFNKADERPRERGRIRRAFNSIYGEGDCTFLNREEDLLELGRCVVYQSVVQYLREDGLYHSAHRDRIEVVRRHLQQEVGRYENHKFYVRPEAVEGQIPRLVFCYTGAAPDRRVEAFMEGYTEEKPLFVPADEFHANRGLYVDMKDYERASRRFGGLWVQQEDIVRFLFPQQVSVLYLFFDGDLQPELERYFSWDELFARQQASTHISRSTRNSQTFLEMVLEGLVRNDFAAQREDLFSLESGFQDFKHVSFYQLGEYRKHLQ